MNHFRLPALVLLVAVMSHASAQDVLLAGELQRVVLLPFGAEDCPHPCAVLEAADSKGPARVCFTNAGGCETMEVKVGEVFLGEAGGTTRIFKSGIGEWGPRFSVSARQVIVNQQGDNISWSPAYNRDGKIYIDPTQLRRAGHVDTRTVAAGKDGRVALDELLERARQPR